MCGISGIINKYNKPVNREQIEKMNNLIAHRGPDGFGYYYGRNFALGHRRLSIIDLSEDGKQPMEYGDRYVIVYNGEIYNYLQLKKELCGYSFKSQTDTEVILAAYDRWGTECVNHFNGMWSFAIYDKVNDVIFCSRDRFGVKPFYYSEFDNKFVFASEIKQFTVFDGWTARANKNRVLDFLLFEMLDHTEETLFQGVYQLKPGHSLIYDLKNHTFNIQEYYSLSKRIKKSNISFSEAKDKFYSIFEDSVKLRLQSDVKLGSCLSGGLDSSSIVCIVNRLLREKGENGRQETVSSCFEHKEYDEQYYIDEVAKHTEIISHKVYPEFNDLFEILDKLTWHQDEPFGSTSIFAQWNVFREAKKKGIIVMLDGQGADEQLAGYEGFYGAYFSELFRNLRWLRLYKESKYLKSLYRYPNRWIISSMSKFLIPTWLKSILKTRMRWDTFDWVKIDDVYYREYLKNLYRTNIRGVRDYSLNLIMFYSLPALLHYEDRDSMAHSVESRVPFLDYRIVEFVLDLPSAFKINCGITKYIMRKSMDGIIPEKIKNRADKMGFVTPENIWIRENREKFREEIKNSCAYLIDLVDTEKALKWFDNLVYSGKPIGHSVWKIVSLGRWMKVFNVKI